jgi:predicted nucleic acid-binding protein
MGDKVFLDTNILVYAYDATAGRKCEIARDEMKKLWNSGLGVVSTQVLQEFYVTVTRKIPKPMEAGAARNIVQDLLKWEVVVNQGEDILEAIDIQEKHHLSFWDALIVQAALRGGAKFLFSEDLTGGRLGDGRLGGGPFGGEFVIKNPFV